MPARTVRVDARRAREGEIRARAVVRDASEAVTMAMGMDRGVCARAEVEIARETRDSVARIYVSRIARARGCDAREPGGAREEEDDVEGAGWMETLERGLGGGGVGES